MESKIKALIETEINPQLGLHNGGCELVSFIDGVATVRLLGGCAGCPSAKLTMFNGVAPILQNVFSEITDVQLEA